MSKRPDTGRIRARAPLLPEPGPEVVNELCDEVDTLRARVAHLEALLRGLPEAAWHFYVHELPPTIAPGARLTDWLRAHIEAGLEEADRG